MRSKEHQTLQISSFFAVYCTHTDVYTFGTLLMLALVLIAAGTLGVCGWYFFVRDPIRARAFAQSRIFQEKIGDFKNHIVTLESHSDEYCAVFSDNEWSKLKETLVRLERVDYGVRQHLAAEEYTQALTILERVSSPINQSSPLNQVDQEIHHIEELINWQRNVHGMLKKVVSNLEVAATTTRELSKARPVSSPRPTLVTLADIKKVLLEDEELRKMSRQ